MGSLKIEPRGKTSIVVKSGGNNTVSNSMPRVEMHVFVEDDGTLKLSFDFPQLTGKDRTESKNDIRVFDDGTMEATQCVPEVI
jgi:hypothetical protein